LYCNKWNYLIPTRSPKKVYNFKEEEEKTQAQDERKGSNYRRVLGV